MTALARLHAAGHLTLGEGRASLDRSGPTGFSCPSSIWIPTNADEWYDGLDQFDAWLVEAMADTSELTTEQRRSRAGIRTRQVTLRV